MSKISSVLDISKRSLMNSQAALQTISHNVASKNVEGYSRQRVELETTPPSSYGVNQFGTGTRMKAVTRTVNEYIEKQIEVEQGRLGTRQGESENLSRVENLVNDQLRKGTNQLVTEFFNAFRELSNSPDNQATRELAGQTATSVVEDFHNMNRQLHNIQEDIDGQVQNEIAAINALTQDIASMNLKIEEIEFTGAPANDERDRRGQALKELGQKINMKYTEGDNGKVVVTAGTNAVIISGGEYATMYSQATGARGDKREGNHDIFFKYQHSEPIIITDQLTGGRLGGALEVRDHVINRLLDKIDNLAYTIAEKVNLAHRQGYDRYNNTNMDFFELGDVQECSRTLKVREDIKDDVWKIAAAGMPDAPGDNRVANLIGSLQHEKWMDEGNSTFNDFFNGIVSQLAVHVRHTNDMETYQNNIVEQLRHVRENISGVNLDEEMVKMIEYQKAFDASAKLIRTADEMLETVLNIKR